MEQQIIESLSDPGKLETLFRSDQAQFRKSLFALDPKYSHEILVKAWHARLDFVEKKERGSGFVSKEIALLFLLCGVSGTIAKLPQILSLDISEFFYRNIGFVAIPSIAFFFLWKNSAKIKHYIVFALAVLGSVLFINSLKFDMQSQTFNLACVFMPLFLWSLLSASFLSFNFGEIKKRIEFLKLNGDVVILSTLILISGGILTGMTMALFSLIKLNISRFYMEFVVIYGLASTPIVATYLATAYQSLAYQISAIIAKIFSSLTLITLVAYLIAIIIMRKSPYSDREFLIVFNLLLVGVMVLMVFSISGMHDRNKFGVEIFGWVLFCLSIVTIILNLIALSAILYRITEYGTTPNKIAVLGSNLLIFTNLCGISYSLFKVAKGKRPFETIETKIAKYLPIYSSWAFIVAFIFPLVFKFK